MNTTKSSFITIYTSFISKFILAFFLFFALLFLPNKLPAADCTGVAAWAAGCYGTGPGTLVQHGGIKYSCNNWWECGTPGVSAGWTSLGACSSAPSLTSVAASSIAGASATLNGNISSDNGFAITARGFIYYTTSAGVDAATIGTPGSCTVTTLGTNATGAYSKAISGLNRTTTYYYKAYATNASGTNYGATLSFTTTNAGVKFVSNGSSTAWTTASAWTPSGTPNLSGSAPNDTVEINHTINYTGNLDIKAGCYLQLGAGGTLNLTGNIDQGLSSPNGTILNAGTITVSGTYTTTGDYTVFTNSGTFTAASISLGGTDNYTNSGNITTTGNFTHNSNGTITSTGGTVTVGGTLTLGADAARFSFTNTNLNITSNFNITGAAGASIGGSTINIGGSFTNTGAAVTTITNDMNIAGNLNNSAGSTFTLSGMVLVNGNVNQTGNSPITVNGQLGITGNLTLTGSGDMNGSGIVGWGGAFSAGSANALRCVNNSRYDTNAWNDPAEPLPPNNPLDLTTCGAGVLPVELISFDAFNKGNFVLLNWLTESEINNDYFEIQCSIDGINWTSLSTVKGAGNSTSPQYYQTTDNNIEGFTIKYYRLKQVDYDGFFTFSPIKSMVFSSNELEQFFVFDLGSQFQILVKEKGKFTISILDLNAKLSYQENFMTEFDNSVIFIEKSKFASGIYILKINDEASSVSKKLFIK